MYKDKQKENQQKNKQLLRQALRKKKAPDGACPVCRFVVPVLAYAALVVFFTLDSLVFHIVAAEREEPSGGHAASVASAPQEETR